MAEAVTTSGQLVIMTIGNGINRYLNKILNTNDVDYIIASDTDSVYINLGPLVKMSYGDKIKSIDPNEVIAFMDKICESKMMPLINSICVELGKYLNVYAQKMEMKREALAEKGIWTAKKKYLLYVYNNEGVQYEKPKLKISGLEAIRSSTPSSCRTRIKDALKIVLTKDNDALIDFIDEFKEEFKKLPLEEIAFPRSVNGLTEYKGEGNELYKKGTPMHVKAVLYYNNEIKKRNLEAEYEPVKEGEKIKYIALKEPNLFRTPVIAFMNKPPREFELEKYVDYETQFEKAFISPMQIVLEKIGWTTERRNSLMKFRKKK
jgi:hypothetical protein